MASALNLVRPRMSAARSGCYTCRSCLAAGLSQPPLAPGQRAAQRRFASKKDSVAILRHYKSQKYQDKILAAQERWDARAKMVKSGEVENTWDMLVKRGLVKDVTGSHEQMSELLRLRRVGAYAGVDPTADSLHIGHLATFMPIFWLYIHGYKAFTLLGGATAKVGDPTGRVTTRPAMARTELAFNLTKLHFQIKKLWGMTEIKMRELGFAEDWARRRGLENNSIWWTSLPLAEVLRYIGTARLGPLLSRDACKARLTSGDGLSLGEFIYPLMQGFDWFRMYQRLNCQIQIGGSDQFGNIVTGIELIKLARESEPDPDCRLPSASWMDDPCGFTVPLLTDKSGRKFGKSEGNAIWLDAFKTTVFDFYGYFVRQPDDEVERLLKMLTFAPLDKIKNAMEEHRKDPPKRAAQHWLALEVTGFVHGYKAAHDVQRQHNALYGRAKDVPVISDVVQRNMDEALQYSTDDGEIVTLENAPRIDMTLPRSAVTNHMLGAVLFHCGMASSRSEGHRLQTQSGVYVGSAPGRAGGMDPGQLVFEPIKLWHRERTDDYLIDGKLLILRRGKHNIRIVNVVSDEEYEASGATYPGQPYSGRTRKLLEKLEELSEMSSAELSKYVANTRRGSSALIFPEFAVDGTYIPTMEKQVEQLVEKVRQAKGGERLVREASEHQAELDKKKRERVITSLGEKAW